MKQSQIQTLIGLMKRSGVSFEPGIRPEEWIALEAKFELQFPPDWKTFLSEALPVSGGFPDWRHGLNSEQAEKSIRNQMNRPVEGILFDIRHNNFWMKDWGEKPENSDAQLALAREKLQNVPKLIPVFLHRYLPSEPLRAGNPVLSVYQTDIIYYGNDIPDYLSNEFSFDLPEGFFPPAEPDEVPFWSYFL